MMRRCAVSVQVSEKISGNSEKLAMLRAELQSINNRKLLEDLACLNNRERRLKVRILLYLREIDRRKLYLEEGYSSMFDFCTEHLGYSRSAACRRIRVARCMGRYPEIAAMLQAGEINITTLSMVSGILNDDNYEEILKKISNRSKRDVEIFISGFNPQREIRDRVRPVCVLKPAAGKSTPTGGSRINRKNYVKSEIKSDSTPDVGSKDTRLEVERRFEIRFSAGEDFMKKLEKVKSLLSRKYPRGVNLELMFEELLDNYLDQNDPERREADNNIKINKLKRTRHIPRNIKDKVYRRDGGRCSFVGKSGRRCSSRWNLQYDHIIPYAKGGDNSPDNLRLLCARHNRLMAEREYGSDKIKRTISGAADT
ncbi:MAG: DUF222 domain-containing protein [Candidatus Latescibacteria bacterium]|nr:DUF222 domain-containing protein [bacterium]MBD3424247.1 DUF222 domain-containing protein [Candidatus Latescibacterota bacterium]